MVDVGGGVLRPGEGTPRERIYQWRSLNPPPVAPPATAGGRPAYRIGRDVSDGLTTWAASSDVTSTVEVRADGGATRTVTGDSDALLRSESTSDGDLFEQPPLAPGAGLWTAPTVTADRHAETTFVAESDSELLAVTATGPAAADGSFAGTHTLDASGRAGFTSTGHATTVFVAVSGMPPEPDEDWERDFTLATSDVRQDVSASADSPWTRRDDLAFAVDADGETSLTGTSRSDTSPTGTDGGAADVRADTVSTTGFTARYGSHGGLMIREEVAGDRSVAAVRSHDRSGGSATTTFRPDGSAVTALLGNHAGETGTSFTSDGGSHRRDFLPDPEPPPPPAAGMKAVSVVSLGTSHSEFEATVAATHHLADRTDTTRAGGYDLTVETPAGESGDTAVDADGPVVTGTLSDGGTFRADSRYAFGDHTDSRERNSFITNALVLFVSDGNGGFREVENVSASGETALETFRDRRAWGSSSVGGPDDGGPDAAGSAVWSSETTLHADGSAANAFRTDGSSRREDHTTDLGRRDYLRVFEADGPPDGGQMGGGQMDGGPMDPGGSAGVPLVRERVTGRADVDDATDRLFAADWSTDLTAATPAPAAGGDDPPADTTPAGPTLTGTDALTQSLDASWRSARSSAGMPGETAFSSGGRGNTHDRQSLFTTHAADGSSARTLAADGHGGHVSSSDRAGVSIVDTGHWWYDHDLLWATDPAGETDLTGTERAHADGTFTQTATWLVAAGPDGATREFGPGGEANAREWLRNTPGGNLSPSSETAAHAFAHTATVTHGAGDAVARTDAETDARTFTRRDGDAAPESITADQVTRVTRDPEAALAPPAFLEALWSVGAPRTEPPPPWIALYGDGEDGEEGNLPGTPEQAPPRDDPHATGPLGYGAYRDQVDGDGRPEAVYGRRRRGPRPAAASGVNPDARVITTPEGHFVYQRFFPNRRTSRGGRPDYNNPQWRLLGVIPNTMSATAAASYVPRGRDLSKMSVAPDFGIAFGVDLLDPSANVAAGAGDGLSFGGTDWVRERAGTNDGVDRDGWAYWTGDWAGFLGEVAAGGYGLWKAGGLRATRFVFDSRGFSEISKEYWARRGPADGRSLHHWLFPQRAVRVPGGVRNAGWNLVELPPLTGWFHRSLPLNQWMGFARNWGPAAATRAGQVENSIRVFIPTAGAGSFGFGYWIGSEINEWLLED